MIKLIILQSKAGVFGLGSAIKLHPDDSFQGYHFRDRSILKQSV